MSLSFRTITPAMDVKAGLIAGFIATIVLSILMVAKSSMGLMPQLNPIEDIVQVAHLLTGMTLPLPFGWIGHFLLGTVVWGIIYAAFRHSILLRADEVIELRCLMLRCMSPLMASTDIRI